MKDSDLLFNILTAAALAVAIILAPSAVRAAPDAASGLYIGTGIDEPDQKFNGLGNTGSGGRLNRTF